MTLRPSLSSLFNARRRVLFVASLSVGLAVVGCFYSPSGTNSAKDVYPTPASGKVTLSYKTEDTEVTEVTFTVLDSEGDPLEKVKPVKSENTEGDFTAELDVKDLDPGLYHVEVTPKDAEEAVATLVFIQPNPDGISGSGEEEATDTEGDAKASPSPSPSPSATASDEAQGT